MKDKAIKTIFMIIVIQVVFLFVGMMLIVEHIPPLREDLLSDDITIQAVYFEREYTKRTLIIEEQSHRYYVPRSRNESSTKEIENLLSKGEVINVKYIIIKRFGMVKNTIVEIQDTNGNYLRTLDGYIAEMHRSKNSLIFWFVFAEIVFTLWLVIYILYCKYILGIRFKSRAK